MDSLPARIVQQIWFHSLNLDLPFASLRLSRALNDPTIRQRVIDGATALFHFAFTRDISGSTPRRVTNSHASEVLDALSRPNLTDRWYLFMRKHAHRAFSRTSGFDDQPCCMKTTTLPTRTEASLVPGAWVPGVQIPSHCFALPLQAAKLRLALHLMSARVPMISSAPVRDAVESALEGGSAEHFKDLMRLGAGHLVSAEYIESVLRRTPYDQDLGYRLKMLFTAVPHISYFEWQREFSYFAPVLHKSFLKLVDMPKHHLPALREFMAQALTLGAVHNSDDSAHAQPPFECFESTARLAQVLVHVCHKRRSGSNFMSFSMKHGYQLSNKWDDAPALRPNLLVSERHCTRSLHSIPRLQSPADRFEEFMASDLDWCEWEALGHVETGF